jgi:hypothetical protein
MNAKAKVGDEEVGYYDLQPRWAREPDFDQRDRLYDGFVAVNEEFNPRHQSLTESQLSLLKDEFGIGHYVSFMAERKQFDYPSFLVKLQNLAKELRPVYELAMGRRTQELFGKPLGSMRTVHANYANGLHEFDTQFPANKLLPVMHRTFSALGLDLREQRNIHVDDANRPKKNPRAFCMPARVPDEVHLIVKPVGGLYDYDVFLHEAGHSLHFANTSRKLDFAYRVLDTSSALTEIYSYLFDHLAQDPAWLEEVVGLDGQTAQEVARLHHLEDLYMFLRYTGKLEYELGYYDDPLNWERNADLYEQTVTRTTKFIHPRQNFLIDFDDGLYSADYLRAWVTQAQVTEHLRERFGRKWFGNPKAGDWLKELWAEGNKPENEDIARRIGATPHDTGALKRFYEEML